MMKFTCISLAFSVAFSGLLLLGGKCTVGGLSEGRGLIMTRGSVGSLSRID